MGNNQSISSPVKQLLQYKLKFSKNRDPINDKYAREITVLYSDSTESNVTVPKTLTLLKPQRNFNRMFFGNGENDTEFGNFRSERDKVKSVIASKPKCITAPGINIFSDDATNVTGYKSDISCHTITMNFFNNSLKKECGKCRTDLLTMFTTPNLITPNKTEIDNLLKNGFVWNEYYSKILPHGVSLNEKHLVYTHGNIITDKTIPVKNSKFRYKFPVDCLSKAWMMSAKEVISTLGKNDSKGWIVLVGGIYSDNSNKVSPYYKDIARALGKHISDNWTGTLQKRFLGVLTYSRSGMEDSVSWEEEVSRGIFEGSVPVPVVHLKDSNTVQLYGQLHDIPYGITMIVNSAKSDWGTDMEGKHRDYMLSILSKRGWIIYGGLSEQQYEYSSYLHSYLADPPPFRSSVVGLAGGAKSYRFNESFIREASQQIPGGELFNSLQTTGTKYKSFFKTGSDGEGSNNWRANMAKETIVPVEGVFRPNSKPKNDRNYNGNMYDYWEGGSDVTMTNLELGFRMPVVYNIKELSKNDADRLTYTGTVPVKGLSNEVMDTTFTGTEASVVIDQYMKEFFDSNVRALSKQGYHWYDDESADDKKKREENEKYIRQERERRERDYGRYFRY